MRIDPASYLFREAAGILTPALAVYPDFVDSNIEAALRLMQGDPNRWRPHLKTAKMPWVLGRLLHYGVRQFKCATTRELLMACESGADDVLLAYAVVGANARRLLEIARLHPETRISVLVENAEQAVAWSDTGMGVFIDVNPGMDRTGIGQDHIARILTIASALQEQFRGLHYYDGQISDPDRGARERSAHTGYDHLLAIVAELDRHELPPGELITSGTPAFPYALTYPGFHGLLHRVSPGTIVFNDFTSLDQLPEEFGFRPAALILATVVSRPLSNRITCDAGHKAVSADAGVPTCVVVGHPALNPLKPSEEHLPIEIPPGIAAPAIGETLYLLPRHICPSVNNFDEALLVRGGVVEMLAPVTGRGHEFTANPSLELLTESGF